MAGIAHRLLAWYRVNKRILPWRDHPDPYAVWVSEIMLQQTRVETVVDYFTRWMSAFPTVNALAQADEQEVLNLWEGLGYYSRARNLHKAARFVVDEYDSQLPEDEKELQNLPGIGRYTAAAIASMAFGRDSAALDGNIRRVYTRLFDIAEPIGTTKTEKLLWEMAEELLPRGNAGDYNQALMDLGAIICTPKSPKCDDCPLREGCKANAVGTVDLRPVRQAKKAAPHVVHAGAVIVAKGRVLLAQRPKEGLLGGMWEFPNGRVSGHPAEDLADVIWSAYQVKVRVLDRLVVVNHAYTHFKITEHAFFAEMLASSQRENLRWVAVADLGDYPMGKVDRKIAEAVLQVR